MEEPSLTYLVAATRAFVASCQQFDGDHVAAVLLLRPFLIKFYPVLRHYRPRIVGECLALSYDDPELGRFSEVRGFGMSMNAGDHRRDRDGGIGSYRDDGSYLAQQAYDYFAKVQQR